MKLRMNKSFLAVLLLPCFVYSKIIEVYPINGKEVIAKSIEIAKDGDEIILEPGHYKENTLEINKSIILRSKIPQRAIIEHLGTKDSIVIYRPNVTLRSLTFMGSGRSSYQDYAAIRINNTEKALIIDNHIINSQYGILLNNSYNSIIESNVIKTEATPTDLLGDGIHLWKSENNKILNNTVEGHRDGIYLEFAKNGYIKDNHISKNIRYGLHFMFSNGNTFENNVFSNNDAGVAVMYSKNITMHKNLFSENKGMASYGLLLKDIMDSEISENDFFDNTVAIYIEGSNRNNYSLNRFYRNLWAIRLLNSSERNIFKNNSFMNNINEVASNGLQSDNEFSENYWGEHSLADINHDGFADIPYQPTSFSAYLLEKYNIAVLLTGTPFLKFLDWLEKMVPSISPISLKDQKPLMKEPR